MKAIRFLKYGSPDVLQLLEVEKPAPKEDEILIQVRAASVNALDWHSLTADIPLVRLMGGGLFKPKETYLGADVAGRVEAIGENVKQFKTGDEVFGAARSGSFAEYAIGRETRLILKPAKITFEQAACFPVAALTALQGLRDKGQIQPRQKVLIQGASGGVGSFAVQIAKSFGAEVTAVCSPRNLDTARSLGAEYVIDYTKEDFTKNGQSYDLILAANGYHPLSAYKRALSPMGIYVMAGGSLAQLIQATVLGRGMSQSGGKRVASFLAKITREDLDFIAKLFEAGKIAPVIDGTYPLDKVGEALKYFGEGHTRGKVVITMK